jgi:hypothetical protein
MFLFCMLIFVKDVQNKNKEEITHRPDFIGFK